MLDDRVYELILLPIMAPRTIAYTLVGFELNQTNLNELKKLTGLDITLLKHSVPVYSTLENISNDSEFIETINSAHTEWFWMERPTFINSDFIPVTTSINPVSILLSADLRPTYQQYDEMSGRIILIVLLVMLVSIIISTIIAHTLTTRFIQYPHHAKHTFSNNAGIWSMYCSGDVYSKFPTDK